MFYIFKIAAVYYDFILNLYNAMAAASFHSNPLAESCTPIFSRGFFIDKERI